MLKGLLAGSFLGILVGALIWTAAALVLETRAVRDAAPPPEPMAVASMAPAGLDSLARPPAAWEFPDGLQKPGFHPVRPRPVPAAMPDPALLPAPEIAALLADPPRRGADTAPDPRPALDDTPALPTVAAAVTAPPPAIGIDTPEARVPGPQAAVATARVGAVSDPAIRAAPPASPTQAVATTSEIPRPAGPLPPETAPARGGPAPEIALVLQIASATPAPDWALTLAGATADGAQGRNVLVPGDGPAWAGPGGLVLYPDQGDTGAYVAARQQGQPAALAYDRLDTTAGLAPRLAAIAERARRDGAVAVMVDDTPELRAAITDWLAGDGAFLRPVPLGRIVR